MRVSLLLSTLAVLALCPTSHADDWKQGRASFYGLDGCHKGSCGFGYQWPDIYPGFDVAAIADASPEFAGSCGRCYEVKCRDGDFTDGYGAMISRQGDCRDPNQSVVVRAVDNCPCNYAGNYYSNKRWCCGDSGSGSAHMDMSIWAFEKLAKKNTIGVMPISFRRVPCDTRPANPAPPIANPSPAEKPWSGAKRPEQQVYVKRFDSIGGPQDAVASVDASEVAGRPIIPVNQLFQGGSLQEAKDIGSGGAGTPTSAPPSPTDGSSAAASSGDSSANGCTDLAPKDGKSCQQHKDQGDCNQNWLISGNLCRASCGRCSLSSSTSSSSSASAPSPSSSSSSGCSDKQPADGTTCSKQKEWGKCEEGWLKSGSFCQATCGHCGGAAPAAVQSSEGPAPSAAPSPPSSPPSSTSSSSASSPSSSCTDTAIPYTISWGDCSKQKEWGKCEEGWLKSGGYCKATCGHCSGGSNNDVKSFEGRR